MYFSYSIVELKNFKCHTQEGFSKIEKPSFIYFLVFISSYIYIRLFRLTA